MRLPESKRFKWNYLGLAFLFPFLVFLMVMLFGGYEPFGNNRSMLYSDMYHQYYPFFVDYHRALRSGDSLLWNWNIGMGLDYLGLFSYYLGSPLNLLSAILPEEYLLEYFSLLAPLKLGLASLFFAIFLKKLYGKNDLSISLFGSFYGLCAWALGYHWNVMWLDTFALLPLVVLGMILMLRDRKILLYSVTLFLSVCINYYIGLFTCIFVFLLFFCYEICRFPGIKRLILDFLRIALCSLLAIGMTAILSLPTLASLQTTYSSVNNAPEGFAMNIVTGEGVDAAKAAWQAYQAAKAAGITGTELLRSWWDAISASIGPLMEGMVQIAGNLGGGVEPTFKDGLPNIYCGVAMVMLSFLFLMSRRVRLRDKLCSVALLLFFLLSFLLRKLDYVWHGFHFPNQIPYRFSFLFSFVMLYMAYRAWLVRRGFKLWQILTAGILSLLLLIHSPQAEDIVFVCFNLIFLVLYLGVLMLPKLRRSLPPAPCRQDWLARLDASPGRQRAAAFALAAVMGIELIMNVVSFGVSFPYTSVSNYPKGTQDTQAAVQYMHTTDTELFYRAEVTHSQTLNDSALLGYNGISTFTSSANYRVTEFLQSLGYSARNNYNRYCYEEASPVANLFLNLKYMIHREPPYSEAAINVFPNIRYDLDYTAQRNSLFSEVYRSGQVSLLENQAYLPLGFLVEPELQDFNFSTSLNAFTLQNRLIKTATGLEEDVWDRSATTLQVTSHDAAVGSWQNTGYAAYQTGDAVVDGVTQDYKVIFTYTATDSGLFCVRLNLPKKNSFAFAVTKAGPQETLGLYQETYNGLPEVLSVCDVEPGDKVHLIFNCKENETGTINVSSAVLNEDVFQAAYQILSTSTLELTEFSNTRIQGSIDCHKDGLLYTSIPQNGNWTALVDGQEVPIVLVGDAMVAVHLTEGTHTVTFVYRNQSFDLGWKVSLGCAGLFLALCCLYYRPWKYLKRKIK